MNLARAHDDLELTLKDVFALPKNERASPAIKKDLFTRLLVQPIVDRNFFLADIAKTQAIDFETVKTEFLDFAAATKKERAEKPYKPTPTPKSSPVMKRTEKDPNALPLLTTLSEIPPVPVDWLWENFIPIGAATLISGDPDAGKTWFMLDTAARVSRGTKWIDGSDVGTPGNVIYLTVEDEAGNTIHPRIITLGGDPDHMKVLTPNLPIYLDLAKPGGLESLENSIVEFGNVRLLVLDPVADFSGRTNANANDEVRKLLTPLIDMAARLRFALVLVGHLNKTIAKQMYKAAGSAGGWVGKCRAAFTVLKDPNGDDDDMRFFAVVKNNLATKRPPLIEFKITVKDGWSARVSKSAVNVDAALNSQLGRKPRERASTLEWLKELFDGRDNIPAAEIIDKAHERGTSTKTLQRAKKDGKYGSEKQKTPEGIWVAVWTKEKQVDLFDKEKI